MVKIRKKTSNRQTTRLRERIKHKVAESHKKAKKKAKKDVTWKSNKPKDQGIPSLFPYKEQVLEEMKQAKIQKEQDRLAQRQQQSQQARASTSASMEQLAASVAARSAEVESFEGEDDDSPATMEVSSSLRAHARSLRAVLARADVIVEVLDARDPQGTRSRAMERELLALAGDKKLILVLNKIDLVPRENVEGWLAYLRRSFPALPFKSSTQSQRRNLGSGTGAAHPTATVAASTSTQPLLSLLKNYARSPAGSKGKASITIGVVGMPNVGKSSLINTLKRSKACGVAPTPGFTREVQEIALDAGLKILDCPGVVFEGGDDGPEKALRNAVRIEQLPDPVAPVEVIVSRCKASQLMMLYNIPTFTDVHDFLICVARSRGRVKKGGIPDVLGAARMVLRDWNAGRIPYYTAPPAVSSVPASITAPTVDADAPMAGAGDAIVSALAPAFDLDALFGEADAAALSETKPADQLKGAVRMETGEPMDQDVTGRVRLMGETSDVENDDMDADDDDVAPSLVPSLSASTSNRKRALPADDDDGDEESASTPTGGKRVTFAPMPKSQKERLFAPDDVEAPPVPLAKKAKLAAKEKRKAARRAANEMRVDEDEVVGQGSMIDDTTSLAGLDVATDALTVEDVPVEDTPYDFAAYFAQASAVDSDGDDEL